MKKDIKKAGLVFILGMGITLIAAIFPGKGILNANKISRNSYGEGDIPLVLQVTDGVHTSKVAFEVKERIFSEEELESLWIQMQPELEQAILNGNKSLDEVTDDLNYPEELEGYPFLLEYKTDAPTYIGSTGSLREEITSSCVCIVQVNGFYEDWQGEYSFPIRLVPRVKDEEAQWIEALSDKMEEQQKETEAEDFYLLPENLHGRKLTWSEEKGKLPLVLGGITVVISALVFMSGASKEKELIKIRDREMREAYPAFVLKFSMLISAGMTLRQALETIGRSYVHNGKKNVLYEEILIGIREMESGVPESHAYGNLGVRCRIMEMRKFTNLLSSNLRKGQAGLSCLLREEAMKALADRREEIRKKGEVAGTKLLFPMLLLLLIVMVMIMIPAFSSFTL